VNENDRDDDQFIDGTAAVLRKRGRSDHEIARAFVRGWLRLAKDFDQSKRKTLVDILVSWIEGGKII